MKNKEINWQLKLDALLANLPPRPFEVSRPKSEFPELSVRVPDSWPFIRLAPLYDVHVGNRAHDGELFGKHLRWMAKTENVITWNGGDLFENLIDPKMGHTELDNTQQFYESAALIAPVAHKMAFALPGNHEQRTYRSAGLDAARLQADRLGVEYFPDYAIVTIRWRNLRFKLIAHHGTGAAATPGAQRNAARKDLSWVHPDLLWTGHLHQPIADTQQIGGWDGHGKFYERTAVVIISPSYVKYFGTYGAQRRFGPSLRGLTAATLHADGDIVSTIHAPGRRI